MSSVFFRRNAVFSLISLFLAYASILMLCAPFAIAGNKPRPSLATTAASATAQEAAHRSNEVLVRFRGEATELDRETILQTYGARRKKELRGDSRVEKLELAGQVDALRAALELRLHPQVEFAEPNFLITKDDLTPSDPRFGEQWALQNTGQTGGQYGSDISVGAAWQSTVGYRSTVIAVIDSGIDFTHPDLSNNRWTNPSPDSTDDLHGWDYITNTNVIKDEQGHGTAVAGIVAAEGDNATGTTGVMWRASLMSLRVLDNTGTGDIADAVEAIDYAVTHGAHVINLSWGTSGYSTFLKDAIERAVNRGVVVICSAGNANQDVDTTPYYPASFAVKDVIAVASTDHNDQLTTWSNWGRKNVTVAAPGVDILTTKMGGDYWNVSGTSASAPMVAGVAGLLKSVNPSASVHSVAKAISDGARQNASLMDRVASKGVVSAKGSLENLRRGNQSVPTPRPGFGTGGTGPGGSFSTTAPSVTNGAPGPNLPNVEQMRSTRPEQPRARTPIQSNLMCADCDPLGGGGGGSNYPSGDPNFSTARRRPVNETGQPGVDLGSRNFNWSLPILSLPGRGLDLDLTLSYNSLVWTKDGAFMKFNADLGTPAAGFRLGLPILQQRYLNSQTGIYSYIMVTPAGSRVEFRQVGSSTMYETRDSSYAQLDATNTSAPVVRTTDGTQFTFTAVSINNEFRCTNIKDRNGNYISATYNSTNGHLLTITDTLGRVITFVYDTNNNLSRIQQNWGGTARDWATFDYGQVYVQPSFGGGLLVNGPNNNYTTVLTGVNLADGSYYTFNYNAAFAQVNRINRYAPNASLLAFTSYNVDSSAGQTECPRFTERRDWAQSWNNNNEAVTSYSVATDNSWSQQTTPDGTIYKEFYHTTGWQTGLPSQTEVWVSGVKEKWTSLTWAQDNTSLSYQENPRVTETNIYDAVGNRRRTTIAYSSVTVGSTNIHLPETTREYGGASYDQVLRRTDTLYNWNPVMLDKRVIGMPWRHVVYEGESTLLSMHEYIYDWLNVEATAPSVHHDTANYGSSLGAARGIVVAIFRYDKNNTSQGIWLQISGYNLAGQIVWTKDVLDHQTSFSYTDSFSDGNNSRGTLAYPTTITDGDNYSSTVQYNFDTGAITRQQDPKGAAVTMAYDSAGRLDRITNQVNSAYKRFVYSSDGLQVLSYETLNVGVTTADEGYSNTVMDGAGRVRAVAAENPGSTGLFMAQLTTYDVMGRAVETTNPTEMYGSWTPSGDDAVGWVKTLQTYDWKGRPLVTTNPDGTTVQNSYGGCGCASGEIITVRDERGRRKRYTKDLLGRLKQVEELNWDQTVYATTTYAYNANDQIKEINQAGQLRTFAYDGHGRLQTRTTPEQGSTSYSYFNDDTIQTITDARGATTTFSYNNRHLVNSITYGVPAGVAATANVSFGYDANGNRTSMTDGLGSVSYSYDTLSRMTSEMRTIPGFGGYSFTYDYNLSGELTSITDFRGVQVGYSYDKMGRPQSVSGSGYGGVSSYVSSMAYRAFGVKQMSYGNGKSLSMQFDNRMRVTDWSVPNVLGWQYSYNDVGENTGRVMFAKNTASSTVSGGGRDDTLDRSFDYDHLGRLIVSHSGYEARLHMGRQQAGDPTTYGPYSQSYVYDQWGNMNGRVGWGGWNDPYRNWTMNYSNNRLTTNPATGATLTYDAIGNLTYDGYQTFTYDATGQQATSSGNGLSHGYDGDRLRVKKVENSVTTYYLRSTVLGGQVVAELNASGAWTRGYVYLGGQMLAIQSGGVNWVHQDPVTKSQRVTNSSGTVVSAVDLDPWGGETASSSNQAFQPHRFTTYERDANGGDEAMMRRYAGSWMRFSQPDPYDGSYDFGDPQSFNRYSYVQNDPINFIDPTGLDPIDEPHWTDFCFSAAYQGCGSGNQMAAFADSFNTLMAFGSAFWDLPGNNNEVARGSFAHEMALAGIPRNAQYIGAFSWGWTDYSHEPFPSYTYSFREDRLRDLIYWGGTFAFDNGSVIRNVHGKIIGERGIDMHPVVDPVWIVAGVAGGLLRSSARGAVLTTENTVARQVTLQTEHVMLHFGGTGLTEAQVTGALRQAVQMATRNASTTGSFWGRFTLRGVPIEYHAYTLKNGVINIGTAYPWPK